MSRRIDCIRASFARDALTALPFAAKHDTVGGYESVFVDAVDGFCAVQTVAASIMTARAVAFVIVGNGVLLPIRGADAELFDQAHTTFPVPTVAAPFSECKAVLGCRVKSRGRCVRPNGRAVNRARRASPRGRVELRSPISSRSRTRMATNVARRVGVRAMPAYRHRHTRRQVAATRHLCRARAETKPRHEAGGHNRTSFLWSRNIHETTYCRALQYTALRCPVCKRKNHSQSMAGLYIEGNRMTDDE